MTKMTKNRNRPSRSISTNTNQLNPATSLNQPEERDRRPEAIQIKLNPRQSSFSGGSDQYHAIVVFQKEQSEIMGRKSRQNTRAASKCRDRALQLHHKFLCHRLIIHFPMTQCLPSYQMGAGAGTSTSRCSEGNETRPHKFKQCVSCNGIIAGDETI